MYYPAPVYEIKIGLFAVDMNKEEAIALPALGLGTATHSKYSPFLDISLGRGGRILTATLTLAAAADLDYIY